ncbi:MAG: PmoA family protein [Candidatus Hydrogenedentes bacterium]|nr:PmoA family protein [Candidatus Hydrogenedentota bacterium]
MLCKFMLGFALFPALTQAAEETAGRVSFVEEDGRLQIRIGEQTVAVYVYEDAEIPRPYFAHVKTLEGVQVTRNHPPQPGDPGDHATFHPGIWLAFGDISGADFWRNTAEVKHRAFVQSPRALEDTGGFAVENIYMDGDRIICREKCVYTIAPVSAGWVLESDSAFESLVQATVFGDQEEMGFGVRMASPLAVLKGGQITNSSGDKNEEQVWGKQTDWADYSGSIDGKLVGIALMAHPENFRKSWFHARDYGLLVANPFGENAFTNGPKSAVPVEVSKPLRLRFAAFIHGDVGPDLAQVREAYQAFSQPSSDAQPAAGGTQQQGDAR